MTAATSGTRTLLRSGHPTAGALALRLRLPQPSATSAGFVIGTLAAGLAGLLWINTAVAEDAYRVHELRQQARAATEQEQAVERAVQALRSPAALAARASALGMVAAGPPAFLLLPDGRVQGQPQPVATSPERRPPDVDDALRAPGPGTPRGADG